MSSKIPDLYAYKKRKQKLANMELEQLLDAFHSWYISHINIREKVRAKHIFSEVSGITAEELENYPWKEMFENWLVYDYVTIIGSKLFDMFVKEKSSSMTTAQMQLSGILLASALKPYQYINKQGSVLSAKPLERGEPIEMRFAPDTYLGDNLDIFLCRQIYWGFEYTVISPIISIVPPRDEVVKWRKRLSEREEENKRLRFLKDYGIYWLKYAPR